MGPGSRPWQRSYERHGCPAEVGCRPVLALMSTGFFSDSFLLSSSRPYCSLWEAFAEEPDGLGLLTSDPESLRFFRREVLNSAQVVGPAPPWRCWYCVHWERILPRRNKAEERGSFGVAGDPTMSKGSPHHRRLPEVGSGEPSLEGSLWDCSIIWFGADGDQVLASRWACMTCLNGLLVEPGAKPITGVQAEVGKREGAREVAGVKVSSPLIRARGMPLLLVDAP